MKIGKSAIVYETLILNTDLCPDFSGRKLMFALADRAAELGIGCLVLDIGGEVRICRPVTTSSAGMA